MAPGRPKPRLVDINSPPAAEPKKLPGIDDATAAKIVAGRTFHTKAELVMKNIIDSGQCQNRKRLVVAKQPYKDGAKSAAPNAHSRP